MAWSLDSLPLTNSFSQLPDAFFSRVEPTPLEKPARLLHFNAAAADVLGLDPQSHQHPKFTAIFSGQQPLPGGSPLAMLYAGHQFGHYVPQLGDGRAILLGETENSVGDKWEIQLKGSGLTPYSRDGDGRAVLRSTIREYLCSEAMHGLGIPTTRALCLVGSDDEVYRERIETAAILTRLAPSHVRFGSFEVFYYRNEFNAIRKLADYVIEHHFPDLKDSVEPYLALLQTVIARTAKLMAQWQAVGFAHGVMNTDNMSILGLTLDYGPYGFMEAYDPHFICNHSDHSGRYAFNQQPDIGLFNLSCFAQALLPLLGGDPQAAAEIATHELNQFAPCYSRYYTAAMQAKLGLSEDAMPTGIDDQKLVAELLALMAADKADYTIVFRNLCRFTASGSRINISGYRSSLRDLFIQREAFDAWAEKYTARLVGEPDTGEQRQRKMLAVNPKYILRNYMAEAAIRQAEDKQNYAELDRLFTVLQTPFDEQPEFEAYADHPPDWADQLSVSCSS